MNVTPEFIGGEANVLLRPVDTKLSPQLFLRLDVLNGSTGLGEKKKDFET